MTMNVDDPLSPLFLVLLTALLIDIIFAWSGIIRGRLPTSRTSVRGARVAGVTAAISAVFLLISYRYFSRYLEFFATIALFIAFVLFIGGIVLSERIPD